MTPSARTVSRAPYLSVDPFRVPEYERDALSETEVLKEGDTVLLRGPEQSFLLRLSRGPQEVERSGVLDLSSHIGQRPGGFVIWAGRDYRLLKPALPTSSRTSVKAPRS